MNAPHDESETRRQRFEAALAEVRRADGFAGDERRRMRSGAGIMAIGVAVATVAFAVSLRLADTRDVLSMVVLAGLGVCLAIVGATLFACNSLARSVRLAVLRLLYERESRSGDGDRPTLRSREDL